jgi:gamma-carbonic anhydrase
MPLILPYKGVMPKIHPSCFIAENAVIIGDVEIGEGSSVWYNCVLRGDVNYIRVGKRTNIQDGTIIHNIRPHFNSSVSSSGGPVNIGDNVTIGHLALIHAATIESDCFVGMGASVVDFAVVESGSWVAANAFIPPRKRSIKGQVWAGSPAKYLRDMTDEEKAFIGVSADNYCRLAQDYLQVR